MYIIGGLIFWFADLVRIKDSANPRLLVNASSGGRQGKYTPVDPEMSSHEDSSIGSDSEDDRIGFGVREAERNEKPECDDPLRSSTSFSIDVPSSKPDSCEARDVEKTRDLMEFHSRQEKRQVGNPYGHRVTTYSK